VGLAGGPKANAFVEIGDGRVDFGVVEARAIESRLAAGEQSGGLILPLFDLLVFDLLSEVCIGVFGRNDGGGIDPADAWGGNLELIRLNAADGDWCPGG
jgi:hypothetical protein